MRATVTANAMPPPPPPASTVGYKGWLRQNLFSSWFNGILTSVLALAVAWVGVNVVGWLIFTADWAVITSRVPLYLVGLYPSEEYWRPEVCLLLITALLGISWRIWGGVARVFTVALGAVIFVVSALPQEMTLFNRILLLLNPAAIGLGYLAVGRLGLHRPKRLGAVTISIVVVSMLLIRGVEGVPGLPPVNPQYIGGLMLNLVLAIFGITMSMPIGIALALGRRSDLPVVKVACVGFIEIVRGVPLITLLFMSRHILPLTFPSSLNISALYLAAITITLFSSAYMAENVRGGMAAVAPGQAEAASALGLRGWQTTLLITLPQGLRNIIPAIVGQFISLFKDTSLVFFIGMLDLVEIGRSALQDSSLEFIDNGREVYVFIAVMFWVFTFSMSYVSRRIERALGVGRR